MHQFISTATLMDFHGMRTKATDMIGIWNVACLISSQAQGVHIICQHIGIISLILCSAKRGIREAVY